MRQALSANSSLALPAGRRVDWDAWHLASDIQDVVDQVREVRWWCGG
jgi:hypothetical protein